MFRAELFAAMLQLEVIPRSLSAMYRQICPLTSSRTVKECGKRVCKTPKCRREAHDPINFPDYST